MITYKIHLLRTGKTSSQPGRRYVGQYDLPLCAEGIEELNRMAGEFAYPHAEMVFTSPLTRCVETAGILYPDVYTEETDGLMDMNLGAFEGKSFEELRGDEDFSLWLKDSFKYPPPGGEDVKSFTQRIVGSISGIFTRMMEERLTSVAVVAHGGVIMTLLAAIGLPKLPLHEWAVENGTGYTLLFTPQMWMRDGAAEVFRRQPELVIHEAREADDSYNDEDSDDLY